MKGYVYVLSNPSMPGLVKIGRSSRSGMQRARELYSTGTATPFALEFELFDADDCEELEQLVFEKLSHYRITEAREFFQLSIAEAVIAVSDTYFEHRHYQAVIWREDFENLSLLRCAAKEIGVDETLLIRSLHRISKFTAEQLIKEDERLRAESRQANKLRGLSDG